MAVRDVYYPLIITFIVLNSIVVSLRVYTRLSTKSLGLDDALMVVALVRLHTHPYRTYIVIHSNSESACSRKLTHATRLASSSLAPWR